MEFTQTDIQNLLRILDNQSISINNLSKRLIEAEILLSSITDIVVEKGVITNEDLLEMMSKKIDIVNTQLDIKSKIHKKIKEERIESFPYFGKPVEA